MIVLRPRSHLVLVSTLLALGCGSPEAEPPTAPPAAELPAETPPPAEATEPEEAPPPVAPAAPTPTTHDVLLLILHEEALLPSEERLTSVLAERMRRRHMDVEMRDVTAEEEALTELFLDVGADPAARAGAVLPATFGAATRVVILRVPAPRTRSDGDRVTRGFAGVVLFRPPSIEPAFVLSVDDESSWRLTDDQWSSWLSGLLRDAEAS